jgi:maltose alpha-D-glucosyltransferase/alpha-amylase
LRIESPPPVVSELLGDYVEMVGLLGKRTAEMHLALASRSDDPAFAPEPFTDFYRQSLYHGMLALSMRSFELLRSSLPGLPEPARSEAGTLLEREAQVRARFQALRDRRINATRIRHHGDFHLGQVLHTGKDFVLIDFEGDPNLPIGQRRIKRSPLRDVASMLRSLHYAAHSALAGRTGFLPESLDDLRVLLDCYLLERALREVRHELGQRQDWVRIPVHGILEILDGSQPSPSRSDSSLH